jgi:hypothetical protein
MLLDKKGTVFIVDISGYSKMVKGMHPTDGITIVRQLLKSIIECNHLSFKISEIEGDAILFYRLGVPPSVEDILKQFAEMRSAFTKIISHYLEQFPPLDKLDLKAIAHYGYMEEFSVDRFTKLYGTTLINAHKLLKNSVPSHGYVLITTDFLREMNDFPLNFDTDCGKCQCDIYDTGSICYKYFLFDQKDDIEALKYNKQKNNYESNLSEKASM